MKEHNHMELSSDDINVNSLDECVKSAYPNRQFAKQQAPLFENRIAELRIRGYRTRADVERMLLRTKEAVERYEQVPKSPSPLTGAGILRAAMLLVDGNDPDGWDADALRVLLKYVKYVGSEDRDS